MCVPVNKSSPEEAVGLATADVGDVLTGVELDDDASVVGVALTEVDSGVAVETATDEENDGGSPPALTAAEVGWTATEVEAAAADEDVALLLTKPLEVGPLALQRLAKRFLGTTVGATTGVEGTSAASLAATA